MASRGNAARVALALAAVALTGCAGPSLKAHLAADADRRAGATPVFTGCAGCPIVDYHLPVGSVESFEISREPLYGLQPGDIERLQIQEHRSAEILGATAFVVVAEPTEAWLAQTATVRGSHRDDAIAWLDGDRVVTFPLGSNATASAFWVAIFPCEADALALAERMGHPTQVLRQSDEAYRASVAELNARNAEMLAQLRADPEALRESGLPEEHIQLLLSEGVPDFPMPPEVYYGPGHELPDCDPAPQRKGPAGDADGALDGSRAGQDYMS